MSFIWSTVGNFRVRRSPVIVFVGSGGTKALYKVRLPSGVI